MARYSGKKWPQEYCDQKVPLKSEREVCKMVMRSTII